MARCLGRVLSRPTVSQRDAALFAVEAAKAQTRVVIADLDDRQRTSWEWGERRAANKLQPPIKVERIPRLQVFSKADLVDVLVVDAPGWAEKASCRASAA